MCITAAAYLTIGANVSTVFHKEYLEILRLAASGSLPKRINKNTDIPLHLIQELVEGGYLKASSHRPLSDDVFFINTVITAVGREYLGKLEEKAVKPTISRVKGQMARGLKWGVNIFTGVLIAIIAAWVIARYFS